MSSEYSMQTLPQWSGREFGCSDWWAVDQTVINTFADATGDYQWIHVDVARCEAESPFGAPIAHGFLTLSLLGKFLMDMGIAPQDCSRVINAGVNNVRFQHPVKAGQRVRAKVVVADVQEKKHARLLVTTSCTLEIEGEDKPALDADITVMMFPQE